MEIIGYQSAKAAMINMTTSLAKALAHTGVTVNTVSPGFNRSPSRADAD